MNRHIQRKYRNDQQVLNTINHTENANQNPSQILPHKGQDGYYQKDKRQQMLTRMWKRETCTLLIGM